MAMRDRIGGGAPSPPPPPLPSPGPSLPPAPWPLLSSSLSFAARFIADRPTDPPGTGQDTPRPRTHRQSAPQAHEPAASRVPRAGPSCAQMIKTNMHSDPPGGGINSQTMGSSRGTRRRSDISGSAALLCDASSRETCFRIAQPFGLKRLSIARLGPRQAQSERLAEGTLSAEKHMCCFAWRFLDDSSCSLCLMVCVRMSRRKARCTGNLDCSRGDRICVSSLLDQLLPARRHLVGQRYRPRFDHGSLLRPLVADQLGGRGGGLRRGVPGARRGVSSLDRVASDVGPAASIPH